MGSYLKNEHQRTKWVWTIKSRARCEWKNTWFCNKTSNAFRKNDNRLNGNLATSTTRLSSCSFATFSRCNSMLKVIAKWWCFTACLCKCLLQSSHFLSIDAAKVLRMKKLFHARCSKYFYQTWLLQKIACSRDMLISVTQKQVNFNNETHEWSHDKTHALIFKKIL